MYKKLINVKQWHMRLEEQILPTKGFPIPLLWDPVNRCPSSDPAGALNSRHSLSVALDVRVSKVIGFAFELTRIGLQFLVIGVVAQFLVIGVVAQFKRYTCRRPSVRAPP